MSKKLTLVMAALCAGSMLFAAEAKNCVLNPGFAGNFGAKNFEWGYLPTRAVKGKKIPAAYLKLTVKEENGKRVVYFQNDEKLKEFLVGNENFPIANAMPQFFTIPEGGTYELTFKAKGKHAAMKGHQYLLTSVGFFVGPRFKNPTRKTQYNSFKMTPQMKDYKLKLSVPENTRTILLTFTLRGIGEMTLADPSFKKVK